MIYVEDNLFEDINVFFDLLGNVDLKSKKPDENWQGYRSQNLNLVNEKAFNFALHTMIEKFPPLQNVNFSADMAVHLRADDFINPHTDPSDYNCLVYLKGDVSQFNGTGFYTEVGDQHVLNATVGFQPNRAILFKGSHRHACLNGLQANAPIDTNRYTLNTFFYFEKKYYEK